jgi:hypothetical protein
LRHCVFERRVSAPRPTNELLVSLPRIGRHDVVYRRQLQAAIVRRVRESWLPARSMALNLQSWPPLR